MTSLQVYMGFVEMKPKYWICTVERMPTEEDAFNGRVWLDAGNGPFSARWDSFEPHEKLHWRRPADPEEDFTMPRSPYHAIREFN